jgi:hypothetical protein
MGITRDKFLLRHVTFGKRDEHGNYTVNYKGQRIGDVVEDGGYWYGCPTGQSKIEASSRHNASEALLDAWIAEHGE